MTPREAADAIFNQAMTAYESGDSATAVRFIPMALTAYRGLSDLDLDARYHMALLSLAADLPEEVIAQADTMMAEVPEHLLALSAAARAYERLGEAARAAEFYRRYLDAYTPAAAASRPEYMDHRSLLPALQDRARLYLENQGGGSS
jgi:tetratricopeptide (TPR) repeat protein